MADHENSTIKHSDHLLLDQPLLRLPHELLRKNFRAAHFTIEKDTSSLKSLLKDSATAALSGRASQQDVLKNLDAMIGRMRGVKRKLGVCAEEEGRLHAQTAARIQHLDELYTMRSVDDVKYEAWSRKRLDRLLADYLLRHGYNNSARELAAEKGMENLVDVDTFVGMSRIREALLSGSVAEALAWCTENKKELRKMESKLEFMLRLQQYIELIRTQSEPKLVEAIAHAKKYLTPYWNTYPKDVKHACGLLAIPPDGTATGLYGDLYKASRWSELADLFTTAHNSLLALPSVPLLHVALSSGLSALKTPACHSSTPKDDYPESATSALGHGVCPICSTELNDLARNVPYAHHTKSHVEHDLFLLPNGRVYSKERLEDYARKSGLPPNIVKDPLTGNVYLMELLKKVFIT
ncbi:negative regulation of gluconeogenesis [Trichoderma cornu-damae]|uniref:Negative regulation of gluconeogenesis n=1 Tax=Trichoderma cornu-damae TaxID=654480 RepID=A0A9P8TU30_9HYPO|nr:negative regulation of gluconeogenesis [Trichoderma cornu-damae]